MPELSVLLSVHDDERFVGAAIKSVLRQTFRDLELIVLDDASADGTPVVLQRFDDPRVVVLRNERQLGLAGSLNRGVERASGQYVARLDADDVAVETRFERQLAALRSGDRAIVGSAIRDLDEHGRHGRLHRMPRSPRAVRWHALFSSPFFHPTVTFDRETLGDLRYDTSFLESEDYELWTRLLATGAEGGNLAEPLVLKRIHPQQASLRRGGVQREFQRRVALREIERVAPAIDAEAAWSFGIGLRRTDHAAASYRVLLEHFIEQHGDDREVSTAAARRLARAGKFAAAARIAGQHVRRTVQARIRVTVVSPEPTPYRTPLFDRLAKRPELDLTVIYAARTVAGRSWDVDVKHRSVFLGGMRVPLARHVLRHDYPITLGIARGLSEAEPDVVVVSGWSTFASQAAIAWCRVHKIPYVLLVESHDVDPRSQWRRAIKGAVVPRLVRNAANVLVVGTLARDSVVARGADPRDVRVFANTIDVDRWIERAERLPRRSREGVVVLSVGRRVPEKGLDVLETACAEAGVALEIVSGGLEEEELARRYVDADIFALVSRHEPWGVVVNEAAASGLPLVLSSHVGAARDLLNGNGFLVPPDDIGATATALRQLADDPELRARMGARSRELVRVWGYEPSVENFVAAVRDAASR